MREELLNAYMMISITKMKTVKSGFYFEKGEKNGRMQACIIDLEYVMHGSYNWSRNAMSNNETLATALDKDFV